MTVYATQNGTNGKEGVLLSTKLSLGNMGFPQALCSKTVLKSPSDVFDTNISCEGNN
jgi:hypothetical protein